MKEMKAENTVWNGLNMETRTGPLRPMLDTWKVVHRPITPPPCSSSFSLRSNASHTEIIRELQQYIYHKNNFSDDSRDVFCRARAELSLHDDLDDGAEDGPHHGGDHANRQRCGEPLQGRSLNSHIGFRTVLQAKTVTPVSRYRQPRIQSLSILMSDSASSSPGADLVGEGPGSGLFSKLTHIAPLRHTTVPKIFALVYLHFHSNLSNLLH